MVDLAEGDFWTVPDGVAAVSTVRGSAALAGARLGIFTASELQNALTQAVGDVEKALVRLALLRTTGDEALIPEISAFLSNVASLERVLDEDFIGVLRGCGGRSGDELAAALEWLRSDS